MFIHAGNRITVSDKKIVGIFNTETILLSDKNERYFKHINKEHKTIVIDKKDNVIVTNVSPFTIINRTSLKGDLIWSREND